MPETEGTNIVPLPHAEAAERSDYQCALTHPLRGRCGRSAASDDHHVHRRSEGSFPCPLCRGSGEIERTVTEETAYVDDEVGEVVVEKCQTCEGQGALDVDHPLNRVLVCPGHHRQIHGQEKPFLHRVFIDDVPVYIEDTELQGKDALQKALLPLQEFPEPEDYVDPLLASGFTLWMLWPDVVDEWESDAAWMDHRAEGVAAQVRRTGWAWAQLGYELRQRDFWRQVDGGYSSQKEYLTAKGLNPTTTSMYAKAEQRLRELFPDTLWDRIRAIPIGVMTNRGAKIEALVDEEGNDIIEELLSLVEAGVPSGELMAHIDDRCPSLGEDEDADDPEWEVTVTGPATFQMTVHAASHQAAKDKVIERLHGYKPLVGIDSAEAKLTARQIDG